MKFHNAGDNALPSMPGFTNIFMCDMQPYRIHFAPALSFDYTALIVPGILSFVFYFTFYSHFIAYFNFVFIIFLCLLYFCVYFYVYFYVYF